MKSFDPALGSSEIEAVMQLTHAVHLSEEPLQMTFQGITIIAQPTDHFPDLVSTWRQLREAQSLSRSTT